jgi:CHAD domain-containing protein
MSFRIHARRHADEEVRRVARERIAEAITALGEGTPSGVHDARKRLKEIRALLRLVHKPLGKKIFTRHNRQFRDIGQQLSSLRDAAAMVECWDALVAQEPSRFSSVAMKRVRARLQARVTQAAPEHPQVHAELLASLGAASEAVADWPLRAQGFALFKAGVLRTCQDGRRAMKAVQQKRSDELLHEWRKRVKDHWYQTRLLRDAWPQLFKARQKSLETLAGHLGDDHDLAVLHLLIDEQPGMFGALNTRKAIAAAIDTRRQQLFDASLELGARLYAEKPESLAELWSDYWKIAARVPKAV